ncbi:hypothetical protein VCSRO165_2924 [Vibrio cholerae]|nr:hypothetical protein VCSRO165_2924 [Vibrio cholerae]
MLPKKSTPEIYLVVTKNIILATVNPVANYFSIPQRLKGTVRKIGLHR